MTFLLKINYTGCGKKCRGFQIRLYEPSGERGKKIFSFCVSKISKPKSPLTTMGTKKFVKN